MPARALNAAHANDHSVRPMRLATAVRPAKRWIGVRAACNVLLSAAAGEESELVYESQCGGTSANRVPASSPPLSKQFLGAHPVRHISETGSSCLGQAERRLGDNATRSLEHDRNNSWLRARAGVYTRVYTRVGLLFCSISSAALNERAPNASASSRLGHSGLPLVSCRATSSQSSEPANINPAAPCPKDVCRVHAVGLVFSRLLS